jgi:hypothetical protein
MVSMLASSTVDHRFESLSGQAKIYKIGIHANHYTIDAVPLVMMYFVDSSSITTDNLILLVVGSVGALAVRRLI